MEAVKLNFDPLGGLTPFLPLQTQCEGEGPYNFLTFFRAAYPTLRVGVCAPYPLIRTLILTVFPSPYNNFKNFRAPYPLLRVGVCAPSPLIKPSPCIPHLRVYLYPKLGVGCMNKRQKINRVLPYYMALESMWATFCVNLKIP